MTRPPADTIFALSSGLPPAGIAVVRISGALAGTTLSTLAGTLPPPRRASLRSLRDDDGLLLDRALVLWMPGPATATGEDLAELHLHGGRAIVKVVIDRLAAMPGLRLAEAGEMTRRAFENGRIDLLQAEGLADLLAAETEGQRRVAQQASEGGLSRHVEAWRRDVLDVAARLEAMLDFADEDDVSVEALEALKTDVAAIRAKIAQAVATPPAERLHDGIRVVLAGRPNVGKSSLLNRIVGREAAIVAEIAGTTRDVIEVPVILDGLPFIFIDTAGLRADAVDPVEAIGIARAEARIAGSDILLWLDEPDLAPRNDDVILVAARADIERAERPGLPVSARDGSGIAALVAEIVSRAKAKLPQPDSFAMNARQRRLAIEAVDHLDSAVALDDPLLVGEELRLCRAAFDRLVGRSGVEDMLDALFQRFCVGK